MSIAYVRLEMYRDEQLAKDFQQRQLRRRNLLFPADRELKKDPAIRCLVFESRVT